MQTICRDLRAEQEELDALVATLAEDQWNRATPFYGWTVKDEIEHLAYFDDRAIQAAADGDAFKRHLAEEIKPDYSGMEDHYRQTVGARSPEKLLKWWRMERERAVAEIEKHSPKDRLPWYGPPMSALSFATARLMETWAHGQDIFDAVRIKREPTDRLRHIAHLGVSTFGWSYMIHGLEVPRTQVRVELTAPSGAAWTWGPEDTSQHITGPAHDFCLVVAQRRHVDDTALTTTGDIARDWMLKAQCFAGMPENGPAPGERAF